MPFVPQKKITFHDFVAIESCKNVGERNVEIDKDGIILSVPFTIFYFKYIFLLILYKCIVLRLEELKY